MEHGSYLRCSGILQTKERSPNFRCSSQKLSLPPCETEHRRRRKKVNPRVRRVVDTIYTASHVLKENLIWPASPKTAYFFEVPQKRLFQRLLSRILWVIFEIVLGFQSKYTQGGIINNWLISYDFTLAAAHRCSKIQLFPFEASLRSVGCV